MSTTTIVIRRQRQGKRSRRGAISVEYIVILVIGAMGLILLFGIFASVARGVSAEATLTLAGEPDAATPPLIPQVGSGGNTTDFGALQSVVYPPSQDPGPPTETTTVQNCSLPGVDCATLLEKEAKYRDCYRGPNGEQIEFGGGWGDVVPAGEGLHLSHFPETWGFHAVIAAQRLVGRIKSGDIPEGSIYVSHSYGNVVYELARNIYRADTGGANIDDHFANRIAIGSPMPVQNHPAGGMVLVGNNTEEDWWPFSLGRDPVGNLAYRWNDLLSVGQISYAMEGVTDPAPIVEINVQDGGDASIFSRAHSSDGYFEAMMREGILLGGC